METNVTSSGDPVVGIIMILISLVVFGVFMWPYVRIVQKAGYSGWNVIWMFVPVANIVMLFVFVFAFSRWPIEDKVARLESKVF